jgi:hypothetical protein
MKEMTNNHRLVLLGRAIHGERWKQPLARDLGIDKRQVQRWAMGKANRPTKPSAGRWTCCTATSNGWIMQKRMHAPWIGFGPQ